MGSSDLSTNLASEILTPASSVRAVESHSLNQNGENKARRRVRAREDDAADPDSPAGERASDKPQHKLDHLA